MTGFDEAIESPDWGVAGAIVVAGLFFVGVCLYNRSRLGKEE